MNDTVPAIRFDMRPVKGHVKLELFDAKTRELVQKVEKENMVTNAIKNALQAYAATNQMGNIMPLATVGLGGIMLFDETLNANVDNVLFPADAHLVGYATQATNTSNTMAGSKNNTESYVRMGENGQSRMVWDFGTSQANGTIKSVALTRNASPFRPLSNAVVAQANWYSGSTRHIHSTNSILAYEDGYVYLVYEITSSSERTGTYGNYTYTRTYTMRIGKTYCPMKNYKVGDSATNNLTTANEIIQSITWTQVAVNTDPNLSSISAPCVDFDGDGNAYIIWSPGNSSGNGTLYITKIERHGLTWRANNTEIINITGAQFCNEYHKVHGGYYYVLAYNRHSFYKIDIENPLDVTQITLPDGYYVADDHFWRTFMKGGVLLLTLYNDVTSGVQTTRYYRKAILYPDFVTVLDGATGENIGDHIYIPCADGYGFGGQTQNYTQYLYGRYFSNYLGTIANLTTPVVKNASQTLKITYTLTDA